MAQLGKFNPFRLRSIILASLFIVVSVALIFWNLDRVGKQFVQDTLEHDAALYSEAIAEFRTLYTSEVVSRVKSHGIKITHNYKEHDRSIPLPATLSMELGQRIGEKSSGTQVRLYSDFPFPWRVDEGGVRDSFQKEAIEALRQKPDVPFFRFEEIEGERYLRFATADIMRPACVGCHNSHPDTPKKDWMVGDVRGVLEITRPIGVAETAVNAGGRQIIYLVLGILILGTVITFYFVLRLKRYSEQIEVENKKVELVNMELQSQARQLEVSRQKAEIATQAKSAFLANTSHEIRTPMTAVLGYAECLLDRDLKLEEREEHIQTILSNGRHLLNILNDILDLSKIEAGQLDVELIPTSLSDILTDLESLMGARARQKGLSFDIICSTSIPDRFITDPTRVRQVLLNLISNAIKFTTKGGVLVLVSFKESGTIWDGREVPTIYFNVKDTGIGISEEAQKKLFKPFSQADISNSRKFGGTGLGLSISKELSTLLGGDIEIFSKLEKYTVFQARFACLPVEGSKLITEPIVRVHDQSLDHEDDKLINALVGQRILVAEDNHFNQVLVKKILEKAGAEVEIAENGREALDLAVKKQSAGEPYNVIFMDMQMPVLDGYKATKMLREKGYWNPIIALTAHALNEERERCMLVGCDDFATKPFNRIVLIQLVLKYSRDLQKSPE